jgi:antitoxin CptB
VSTSISSADLDPRRRRMLFRAWHRGMKEMDILMGKFADAELAGLGDVDLDAFEALMDAPDPDIFKWLTDAVPVPAEFDTPLFHKLKRFHTHAGPIHG